MSSASYRSAISAAHCTALSALSDRSVATRTLRIVEGSGFSGMPGHYRSAARDERGLAGGAGLVQVRVADRGGLLLALVVDQGPHPLAPPPDLRPVLPELLDREVAEPPPRVRGLDRSHHLVEPGQAVVEGVFELVQGPPPVRQSSLGSSLRHPRLPQAAAG